MTCEQRAQPSASALDTTDPGAVIWAAWLTWSGGQDSERVIEAQMRGRDVLRELEEGCDS